MMKSKSIFIPVIIIILTIIIFSLAYFSKHNQPKSTLIIGDQKQNDKKGFQSIITNQKEYINYKYNFGLSFPYYWKDFKPDERNGAIEFSLRNKDNNYVPIFNIKAYSNDEFIKRTEQENTATVPTAIDTKEGFTYAYLMIRNDQNLSEFGGIFSESGYKKPYFDVRNNIIPTFKFIEKEEVFNKANKFQKDNEFKLIEAKVDNNIAGMKIISNNAFPDGGMIIDDLSIRFSGEVLVTGIYHNDKTDPATGFGGQVCFDNLDEQSLAKIPNPVWNNKYVKFCFKNQELVKNVFKPEGSSGLATIVIDDYVINRMPAELTDTAKLIKVIGKD